MPLKYFLEKINLNVIIQKISDNYVGALMMLFLGLSLLLLTCNRTDGEDCKKQVQALNDTLRAMESREKMFYRNLYFERQENQSLKDSLDRYKIIEQFNTTEGPKQIILSTKNQ